MAKKPTPASRPAAAQAPAPLADHPRVSANTLEIIALGNDFLLLLSRPEAVTIDGRKSAVLAPAVSVQVSKETLKDASLLLSAYVRQIEEKSGPISTAFTESLLPAE